jgi:hypothetical protein
MPSKDTSTRVETRDDVAHLLGTRKELSAREMLGGLLGP